MRKDAIAVIGRMATGTVLLDGQTVKTNTLRQELRTRYPDRDFVFVDMYQYKRRAIPVPCACGATYTEASAAQP